MKVAIFSCKPYEKPFLVEANKEQQHELIYIEAGLSHATVTQALGCEAACCFVTDTVDRSLLKILQQQGVRLIALRSAGFDNVDIKAARKCGITVVRVPYYSPEAIAEFTIGLMLALSRKIIQAVNKVAQHNFSLVDQLGFNLQGRTVGIIGTGQIGSVAAKLLLAFGCKVIASDPKPSEDCERLGVNYVTLDQLYQQADVISLHCPLNAATRYMINADTLALMKSDVVLINTGRGALINTSDLLVALENKKIAAVALDVYEHEHELFFVDRSKEKINDKLFLQLQSYSNVIITGHQAYFSVEALTNIMTTTLANITAFAKKQPQNLVG